MPTAGIDRHNLELSVELHTTEPDRIKSIDAAAKNVLGEMLGSGRTNQELREMIWPALCLTEFSSKFPKKVVLHIIPLSRIGQMEGQSGSLVLIGWFESIDIKGLPHSHPVVIKSRPPATGAELREEYDNAQKVRTCLYDRRDRFAVPFRFDDGGGNYHILWSLFLTHQSLWSAPATSASDVITKLKVKDLRSPLESNDADEVLRILSSTYDLLQNVHRRIGTAQVAEVKMFDHYEWYFRNFGKKWGAEWESLFGRDTEQYMQFAGRKWTNPIWMLKRLRNIRKPLFLGAVHGDLHPGNIVVANDGTVRIIDFGWASDLSHIAKDFVLMECNLRFLTLPLQLSDEMIDAISGWIGWGDRPPRSGHAGIDARIRMIKALRTSAASIFPPTTNWNVEYIIPLFFVAFGLLRFYRQLGNQRAAIRTVLELATYLGSRLK